MMRSPMRIGGIALGSGCKGRSNRRSGKQIRLTEGFVSEVEAPSRSVVLKLDASGEMHKEYDAWRA